MAESDCADCRCSNISIMQLFHELKQRYPTVPDQIVSKVIQQNFHDKTACETILNKESHSYVQGYPGALISGDGRSSTPLSPLSDHCSAQPKSQNRGTFLPHPEDEVLSTPHQLIPGRSLAHKSPVSGQTRRIRNVIRQAAVESPCSTEPAVPVNHDPLESMSSPCTTAGQDGVTSQTTLCASQQQTGSDVIDRLPLTPTSDCDRPGAVSKIVPKGNDYAEPILQRSKSPTESSRRAVIDPDASNSYANPSDEPAIPNPTNTSSIPANIVTKSRPLSLEEKIELTKIPLGQLVREVRERHNGSVASSVASNSDESATASTSQSSSSASINSDSSIETVQNRDKHEILVKKSESDDSCHNNSPSSITRSPNIKPAHIEAPAFPASRSSKPTVVNPLVKKVNCDNLFINQPSLPLASDLPSPLRMSSSPIEASGSLLFTSPRTPPPPSSSPNPSIDLDKTRKLLAPPYCDPMHYRVPRPQTLNVPDESTPSQEYQVAVECRVCPGDSRGDQRSFTSVNLTLRPPSTETPLPIEISSGQSLTYTTARFDRRQGYQSQVQIRIVGRALLQQQKKRKDVLERELHREREKLHNMRLQVRRMEEALSRKPSPYVISRLKSEIDHLRSDCERLTTAVDLFSEQGNFPLGETDEDFYRNIYTGQRPQRVMTVPGSGWSCRICTFRNHPLLNVCEECEMPRLSLGTTSSEHLVARVSNPLSNNNSSCAAEETSTSVSRTMAPLQER